MTPFLNGAKATRRFLNELTLSRDILLASTHKNRKIVLDFVTDHYANLSLTNVCFP